MADANIQAASPAPAEQGQAPNPGQTPIGANQNEDQSAIKEAVAEAKRRLKIDDQEVDEDEVIKVFKERKGHQNAANKILQEGKAAKKQAEAFVQMMRDKGRLFDVIQKLGHDPRKLAEEFLAAQLEEEMLDPKEKELRDLRRRAQEYEEREKKAKEDAEREQHEKEKAHYAKKYNEEFIEALKTVNLPGTKPMVAAMAGYIARAAALKLPMTALEAAKLVDEDETLRIKHRIKNATPEQIIAILEEEGVQKIRAHDVAKLKDPAANLRTPTEQPEPSARQRAKGGRMTPQEWRAFNRK